MKVFKTFSDNPWVVPSFRIRKKIGTIHLQTNFRQLNKRIVSKPFLIPKVNTCCILIVHSDYFFLKKSLSCAFIPSTTYLPYHGAPTHLSIIMAYVHAKIMRRYRPLEHIYCLPHPSM